MTAHRWIRHLNPARAASTALALGLIAPPGALAAEGLLQLMEQRRCQGCDLAGADLVHAQLADVDLRGARLQRANLSQAKLDGARLNGADLSYTSLLGASLRGADLRGARLEGTDLPSAAPIGREPGGWTPTCSAMETCTTLAWTQPARGGCPRPSSGSARRSGANPPPR
jgi:uncharacterized protein YjbI with pentapeptide repeats